jgi:Tfp pilus assembly protein PilF
MQLKCSSFNVRAHPTSARAYDNLVHAYLKCGSEIEAIRYLREALRIDPGLEAARRELEQLESKEEWK